jgi:O-acetylserine/cysteine efflux transporter
MPLAMPLPLPLRHFLLALAVVTLWGTNFVVMKQALADLPPLLLTCLRFVSAVLPGIFFLPRPNVPMRNVAQYGLLIGVGQFGLLFFALNGHVSPGIASLVMQLQVFFTIGLSMWLAQEKVHGFQWVALALAAAGLVVIEQHTDGSTTLLGLGILVVSAMCWALGNITAKQGQPGNMLAYMVWSSLFAVPPLFLLSLLTEGWPLMSSSLRNAGWFTWAAVLWQGWANTLFGFGVWAWLLARHPAATITPMALLVPVFGMGASAIVLAEPLPAWKLWAAALVMSGLALNLLWPRLQQRLRKTA